jgi:hypothetical protein
VVIFWPDAEETHRRAALAAQRARNFMQISFLIV